MRYQTADGTAFRTDAFGMRIVEKTEKTEDYNFAQVGEWAVENLSPIAQKLYSIIWRILAVTKGEGPIGIERYLCQKMNLGKTSLHKYLNELKKSGMLVSRKDFIDHGDGTMHPECTFKIYNRNNAGILFDPFADKKQNPISNTAFDQHYPLKAV